MDAKVGSSLMETGIENDIGIVGKRVLKLIKCSSVLLHQTHGRRLIDWLLLHSHSRSNWLFSYMQLHMHNKLYNTNKMQ